VSEVTEVFLLDEERLGSCKTFKKAPGVYYVGCYMFHAQPWDVGRETSL
jgi:hypothetical protein